MGIQINGATDSITAIDGTIDVVSAIGNAGVVTATAFVGNITGNVTGNINHTSNLELQTGGVTRAHFNSSGHFNVAGISTFTGVSNHNSSLNMLAGNNIVLLNNTNSANCQIDCYGGAGFRLTSYNQTMFTCENGATTKFYTNSGNSRLEITNGGDVQVISGTLHIPDTLQHYGDADTKIRFPAADTVTVETAGSERLRITSSGLVGIGTNNPTEDLHITAATPVIRLEDSDTSRQSQIVGIDGNLRFDADNGNAQADTNISFRTDGSEKLRIASDGKLCIAHTSALHSGNLQVSTSGADAIDINAYSSTADNGGRLTFYRSKNASIGSNTIVVDDDSLGRIDFRGYNTSGNSYNQGATIEARVDGSVNSSTDMPSAILFKTSEDGSASPTERLRINSSGQLIMTNAATQTFFDFSTTNNSTRGLFSISGKDGSGNAVTVKIGGFGDTNRGEIFTHSNHGLGFATNNAAAQMVLTTGGHVNIGGDYAQTTYKFKVTGTSYFDGDVTVNGDELFIADSIKHVGDTDTLISFPSNDTIKFNTAGSERLRIDSSGRLLLNQTSAYSTNQMMIINGASPAGNVYNGQLMIQGSETNGSTDTGARINFAGHDGNTQRSWANITGAKENGTGGNQAAYLSFHTRPDGGSPTERLRITSVGRMGLGDSNPEARFHLRDTGTDNANGFLFETGTSGVTAKFVIKTTDNGDQSKYLRLNGHWTELGVHNNEGFRVRNSSNNIAFYLNAGGSYQFSGSNLSDRNLKEDIETISTPTIDLIKQVSPKLFKWKNDINKTQHGGFIAQEMQPLFPKLISGTDYDESRTDYGDPNEEQGSGNPTGLAFDYDGYTAYLTKAMQELIAKVETLEAKVAALEGS